MVVVEVLAMWGCDMMETAPLTSSSADFEDMITQFRHRLRPPPALTLADWLRANLGLSGAKKDFDFSSREEVRRQLRAVLRAVSQELEIHRQDYGHLEAPQAAA
jgi:hypothetical protein